MECVFSFSAPLIGTHKGNNLPNPQEMTVCSKIPLDTNLTIKSQTKEVPLEHGTQVGGSRHQDHQKKPGRRLEMAISRGIKEPTHFGHTHVLGMLRGEGQKLLCQELNSVCGAQ